MLDSQQPSRNPPPPSPWNAGERESVYAKLEALAKLCVTRGGGPALADHIDALAPYLEAFQAPIATAAINQWPHTTNGRFFPTASELIDVARALDVERRTQEAMASTASEQAEQGTGRYAFATGRAANVVRRITAADPKFTNAWLKPRINVQYRPDTIYTTGIGFDRLSERFAAILDNEGVTLVACPQVSHMLAKHCAMVSGKPNPEFSPGKPKTRLPKTAETPAERKAVVAALRAAGVLAQPAQEPRA